MAFPEILCKVQAQRLLSRLKEPCKEHDWHLHDTPPMRKDCPKCMAQIEEALK
jgi:hypothetical protein